MKNMLRVWMMVIAGSVCAQTALQDVPDATVVGPSNDPFLFSVIRGNAAYGTNAFAVANAAKTTAVNASNRVVMAEGTINALVSTQRVVVAQMGSLVSTQAVQSVTISNAFSVGMAALVKANEALSRENMKTNSVNLLAGVVASSHNTNGLAHEDIRASVSNAIDGLFSSNYLTSAHLKTPTSVQTTDLTNSWASISSSGSIAISTAASLVGWWLEVTEPISMYDSYAGESVVAFPVGRYFISDFLPADPLTYLGSGGYGYGTGSVDQPPASLTSASAPYSWSFYDEYSGQLEVSLYVGRSSGYYERLGEAYVYAYDGAINTSGTQLYLYAAESGTASLQYGFFGVVTNTVEYPLSTFLSTTKAQMDDGYAPSNGADLVTKSYSDLAVSAATANAVTSAVAAVSAAGLPPSITADGTQLFGYFDHNLRAFSWGTNAPAY